MSPSVLETSFAIPPLFIRATFSPKGLCRLRPLLGAKALLPPEEALADLLFEQLRIYLSGRPVSFEIPLDLRGSSFQEIVWRALREIPFGATITYGQLACRIGRPRAARAVGMALAQNPVPILVPCHRVVAKGGLGGFSGGLELKRFLLNLEGVFDEPIPELPDLPLGS